MVPRKGWAVGLAAILALAVLIPGCGRASTDPSIQTSITQTSAVTMTTAVAIDWVAYVNGVFDLLEEHYLWADEVSWDEHRSDALAAVGANPTRGEAHAAIRRVISDFRGHTQLVVPEPAPDGSQALPSEPPSGSRMGDVGYLKVPALPGINEQYRTYAADLQQLMKMITADRPACGWVVDLRGNVGGIMQPMHLGVGPLLGDGVFLTYDGPEAHTAWSYADGVLYMNGEAYDDDVFSDIWLSQQLGELPEAGHGGLRVDDPFVSPDPEVPVAVLFGGGGTSSAGEGVLVAFIGRPNTRTFGDSWSAGYTDFGQGFVLADGALLTISNAVAHDRLGRAYPDPVLPDELILGGAGGGTDPVLDAALTWLAGIAGCTATG